MQPVPRLVYFLSILSAATVFSQNTPPTISAGPDTTTRLRRDFSFGATFEDDGLLNMDPSVQWTKLGGPPIADYNWYPASFTSQVTFTETGVYTFQLSVNDGEYTVYDTVVVTVLDSLPYLVLAPTAGEKVVIGSTYVISWQIDPAESFIIRLSTDGGATFPDELRLTHNRVSPPSYTWIVPATLPPGDSCVIWVADYFGDHNAYSEFFSLVTADSLDEPGQREKSKGCGAGAILAFCPAFGYRLVSRRKPGASRR